MGKWVCWIQKPKPGSYVAAQRYCRERLSALFASSVASSIRRSASSVASSQCGASSVAAAAKRVIGRKRHQSSIVPASFQPSSLPCACPAATAPQEKSRSFEGKGKGYQNSQRSGSILPIMSEEQSSSLNYVAAVCVFEVDLNRREVLQHLERGSKVHLVVRCPRLR